MEWISTVSEWVNSPLNKTVLLVVGGLISAKFTDVVNKFIPIALMLSSTLATGLGAMFPSVAAAEGVTAMYAAVGLGGVHASTVGFFSAFGSAGGWLVSSLVPAVLAVGAHSATKNTKQWWQMGHIVWNATQNPSKQAAKKLSGPEA